MALSAAARRRLEVALAHRATAKEIADAVDSGGNAQAAAAVADVSVSIVTADLPSALALADANKVAINALLASLRAAGLLAP